MSATVAMASGAGTPVVHDPTGFSLPASQKALIRWNIYIAFAAMGIAVIHGLAQALSYAGIDVLGWFPGLKSYYQGLTIHGVFNGIVLTFAFSNGFLSLAAARALGRRLHGGLLHASLWTLVAGLALACWAMYTGRASVLYTSYAPLQAHWTYYLGLVLMVVSTWLTSANLFAMLAAWRRENPGRRIPLLAFVSTVTYVMWDLASLGIAFEYLVYLLPWSLGWRDGVDPLLTRSLFWYTGHPIVYFWLLPAYVSWYTMVPKLAGGRLISDSLTRIVFLLFLLLSIPTGFHHQFSDPGIPTAMKMVHVVMTFGVFFPSVITAFSVASALEIGGRRRGGGRLIGWFFKLPWNEPALAAQLLAMLVFVLGGVTGLINASYSMNQVIHNTAWVPGHFHMTVGTAVALSFMGIAYWMVPWLKDRELWGRKLALAQSWLYFIGVLAFARGMISGGLEGLPRRTFRAAAAYTKESWDLAGIWTGVGGTMMFASAMLFLLILVMTVVAGKRNAAQDIPFTETIETPATTGWEARLDHLRWYVIAAVVLILVAYGPYLAQAIPSQLSARAFRLF
ncbi:MAG TPA: cbb3-type cytochrome c oxidase subunit I [Longimicrobiales bacterium]